MRLPFYLTLILGLSLSLPLAVHAEDGKEDSKQKKPKTIIEEVVVTGKTPAQMPVSRTSVIPRTTIEALTPRHMADVIHMASGAFATDGNKNESRIMVRGLSSNRMTLMLDGIPVYEPYFNSFDLKTISTSGVESVKVIKGASSVLYGANTLGGVVNVVTLRPDQPFFTLKGDLSENATHFINASAGGAWERFAMYVNATLDSSDGFETKESGEKLLRENSDWNRKNFSGKLYFSPSKNSEIMAQVMYNTSEYGIPAATEYLKARIWRFKDWQRLQLNLSGTFPLTERGILKVRTYYVRHFNALDQYKNLDLQDVQWESTYKNHSKGAIVSGDYSLSERNTLKFSLNFSDNVSRQQGDVGDPWEEFDRSIFSVGIEDHLNLGTYWRLVGGISMDSLKKDNGETETRLNPIVGVKFMPREDMAFHASFSNKTRFPSMKSLYSTSSGNPDLTSEIGTNFELGFSLDRGIRLNSTVFFQSIRDMIQSYRGLDGYRNYQNVGRAEIYGFENEITRRCPWGEAHAGFTWLHTEDLDTGEPLDYVPELQFSVFVRFGPFSGFSLGIWGVSASASTAHLGKEPPFEVIDIPAYTTVHMKLEKRFKGFTIYLKAENLLDEVYFSEPGFPMRARTISFGAEVDVRKYR